MKKGKWPMNQKTERIMSVLKTSAIMISTLALFYHPAHANEIGLGILVNGETQYDNIVIPKALPYTNTAKSTLKIALKAVCFGTNLRSVTNPLAPNAKIKTTLIYNGNTIVFSFPGSATNPASNPNPSVPGSDNTAVKTNNNASIGVLLNSVPVGTTAARLGNMINLTIPDIVPATATLDASGKISITNRKALLSKINFYQYDIPQSAGQFYGKEGTLSTQYSYSYSTDGGTLMIEAHFPGQEGFCGGYHSPLMLFFDNHFPQFTGKSTFPLDPQGGSVYWMEPGAPGFLLVYDADNSGKITQADQLFGQSKDFKNGFEALSRFDSNQDQKIDSKDPVFTKLKLWKDKNGNGVSEPGELFSLSELKVTEISLQYDALGRSEIENRAIFRENALFKYVNSKGKLINGRVIDVWFSRAE